MWDWHAIIWLFPTAVTLHNTEEGIWLPAFSKKKGYWRIRATVAQIRFILILVTVLAWICAFLAARGSAVGTYLLCTYAVVMLLNVFFPHLIATIILRQYAPGTATALLFNLPVSCRLLFLAVTGNRISVRTFAWGGPVAAIAILALIPLCFYLPRRRGQEARQ